MKLEGIFEINGVVYDTMEVSEPNVVEERVIVWSNDERALTYYIDYADWYEEERMKTEYDEIPC